MEYKNPKSKRHVPGKTKFPLPPKTGKEIAGIFNGQNVTVHDYDSMNILYYSGNFGKGSLSKGAPNHHARKDDIPKIIFEQQYQNQARWNSKIHYTSQKKYFGPVKNNLGLSIASIDKLLESSFSCAEEPNWKTWKEKQNKESESFKEGGRQINDLAFFEFKDENDYRDVALSQLVDDILVSKRAKKSNTSQISEAEETVIVLATDSNPNELEPLLISVSARLEKLPYIAEENLNLNLEEAFFLKCILGCLKIVDLNLTELNVADLWEKFNAVQRNFIERYVTYHYYRAKGWVVRSGLKFGGDYLLYKDGPDYFHASYLVKVLDRRKKFSWTEFTAMNRLVETFNKDLVLSNVTPAEGRAGESFPGGIKNHAVQEVLVRRWFPSRERLSKEESQMANR